MNELSRRVFVTASAALAMTPAPVVAQVAPAGAFDRAAFAAVLERPYPHRQVTSAVTFDSAAAGLHFLMNSVLSYADPNGFGAGPNTLHVAAVFYGGPCVAIALNDEMWEKYPLALMQLPPEARPATPPSSLAHANPSRALYEQLANQHGASFFVCNNALTGLANDLAKAQAGPQATREQARAIHDELAAHFLAGSMLVPTGVGALNAVQEAHFTLLPSR